MQFTGVGPAIMGCTTNPLAGRDLYLLLSIAVLRLCWLEWTDSNCRMHVYQTCALTNFATLHHHIYLLAEGRRFELPGRLYDDRLLSKELL